MTTLEGARLRQQSQRMRKNRFMDNPAKNLWRYAANTLLCLVLAFFFVYGLNKYSERSGSIIRIVEPARSPLFLNRRNNLPVMRIPLGAPIEYDLVWYYLEGGCDTHLSLKYEQKFDSPPRTTISLDIQGRNLPIGSPGSDHVVRPQPVGITPGLWKYSSTLYATCANGRKPPPETVTEFYIDIYDPKEPIVALTSPVTFDTHVVKADGYLKWRYDFTRRTEGSSTAIYTLISKNQGRSDAGVADVIIMQRPVAYTKIGTYKNNDIVFDLPSEIHTGEWTLQVSIMTNLPNGTIQTDNLFSAKFEVVL